MASSTTDTTTTCDLTTFIHKPKNVTIHMNTSYITKYPNYEGVYDDKGVYDDTDVYDDKGVYYDTDVYDDMGVYDEITNKRYRKNFKETTHKSYSYGNIEKVIKKSSWDKYIKRITKLVYEEMPSMCLVEKNNVYRKFVSNIQDSVFEIEFRFKGTPDKMRCEAKYTDNGKIIYHKIKKTPKKLYKSINNFVYDYDMDNPNHPLLQAKYT